MDPTARIVVPTGMLKAVVRTSIRDGFPCDSVPIILEAALRWLADNPIVPTDAQRREISTGNDPMSFSYICIEWQRRMFLAPEPEAPEEIKDLLCGLEISADYLVSRKGFNSAILEAYRRGQKAGKQ